jgi:hypothetical protein
LKSITVPINPEAFSEILNALFVRLPI